MPITISKITETETETERDRKRYGSAMKMYEFPHSDNDERAFIYVKVNLQYLCKVRHATMFI